MKRSLFINEELTIIGDTVRRKKKVLEKQKRIRASSLFLTILRDTKRLTNFYSFIVVACVHGIRPAGTATVSMHS